jgi:hypothetical protein
LTAAAPATAEAADPPMPPLIGTPLRDRQARAEVRPGGVEHRLGGGERRIVLGRNPAGCRRGPLTSPSRTPGRASRVRDDLVARRVERLAEHVEADADIADAGRRRRREAMSIIAMLTPSGEAAPERLGRGRGGEAALEVHHVGEHRGCGRPAAGPLAVDRRASHPCGR